MSYKTPTSELLKSEEKDYADITALGITSSAELRRLSDLLRPGSNSGATIINRERPATKATLAVWGDPATNVATDTTTQESALAADVDSILRGEPLVEKPDTLALFAQENRKRAAIELALESKFRDIAKEKTRLAIQWSAETLKPIYDKEIGIVFKTLVDLYPTLVRLQELKRHCVDDSIGFRSGVFAVTPETLFDNAFNKHSPLATFLNEGKRLGYLKQMPKELI